MNIVPVDYPTPTGPFTPRPAAAIRDWVLHHTAGPLTQTPLEIDAFERTRGDIYLPYNYLVDAHIVYAGRPINVKGAATYGDNEYALAVCVIGNYQSDDAGYTGQPDNSLIQLLIDLRVFCQGVAPALSRTIGHCDAARENGYTDQCPGNTLYSRLPEIRDGAHKRLGL